VFYGDVADSVFWYTLEVSNGVYMISEYRQILDKSNAKQAEIQKKMRHLSKMHKNGFDQIVARYHDEVFAKIDCTKCGNCCRALGPRFRETDIKIICKETGRNPKEFKTHYLKEDDEGVGFVLKEMPCPFQNEDNLCSVYDIRTLSCREFPHTQSRSVQKHLVRLAWNSLICPAAYLIAVKIMEEY
jgi:Fe-S-cluster containining protein